jgi:hypothetical protein
MATLPPHGGHGVAKAKHPATCEHELRGVRGTAAELAEGQRHAPDALPLDKANDISHHDPSRG